jgi:UDP-N-acetylglucosamine--N-acetylmuramyl-(pentapeptide) pyrophosphoryl-undecaprenol N-acetylglucosamine transferase
MLAVLDALQKRCAELNAPLEIVRMGPRDGYEVLFQNRGVTVLPIVSGKMRRYFSLMNIVDVPKFFIGFFQALFRLYLIMPDVIFSKGGTGALPVVAAGWFYRIPVMIHESDAEPGRTNLASARFAKKIFVSFERAAGYFDPKKTEVTGAPMRSELFAERTTRELAKDALGFSSSHPLVLVLGGSQGSTRVNDFIITNLAALAAETQVLHQTGVGNLPEVKKLSQAALLGGPIANRYLAVGYLDDNLSLACTAADLVVTRAGSDTIATIAAFGLPAIFIPLAGSANDHQRANAYEFGKTGAAVVIEEANLLPGIFLSQIKLILTDDALRAKMSAASARFFIPGAAEKIAEEVLRVGT